MSKKRYKFGKRLAKKDSRDFLFSEFLIPAQLPPLPPVINFQNNLPSPLGTLGNDHCRNCTCAAAGHLITSWTATTFHVPKVLPVSAIILAYSTLSDYDPSTGGQDNGAHLRDMLNLWRTTGIGNDRIDGFARVRNSDMTEIKQAIFLFGGCLIGLKLPTGFFPGSSGLWQIPPDNMRPNYLNGHAVPLIGYNTSSFMGISFGHVVQIPFNFISAYGDEAWVALSSQNWINQGRAVNGFDLTSLRQTISAMNNQTLNLA